MDVLDWCVQNVAITLATCIVIAATGIIVYVARPDQEAAVEYHVPLPPQCEPGWKGEVLENPSIKVCQGQP